MLVNKERQGYRSNVTKFKHDDVNVNNIYLNFDDEAWERRSDFSRIRGADDLEAAVVWQLFCEASAVVVGCVGQEDFVRQAVNVARQDTAELLEQTFSRSWTAWDVQTWEHKFCRSCFSIGVKGNFKLN